MWCGEASGVLVFYLKTSLCGCIVKLFVRFGCKCLLPRHFGLERMYTSGRPAPVLTRWMGTGAREWIGPMAVLSGPLQVERCVIGGVVSGEA